jgi:large subunit ribosomal protein L18
MSTTTKKTHRAKRHARVRAKVSGTAERPRVCVFKSNQHLFVQVVDDSAHRTMLSIGKTKAKAKGTKTEQAKVLGASLAKDMKDKGIERAVFDAGGFKYHGRVKAVAEGLREGGIAV